MRLFLSHHWTEISIAFGALAVCVGLIAFSIFGLAGCSALKSSASTPVPGAVNQFDSDAWTALYEYKAVIDQAKTELAAGNLPVSPTRTILNDAIGAYNLAEGFASRYHDSGGVGTDAATLQAEITQDLAAVAQYVVALRSSLTSAGKTPAKAPAKAAPIVTNSTKK